MISILHVVALIPVAVLLFFITVVPEGGASGGLAITGSAITTGSPITTCAACTQANGKWCIKDLGHDKKNKFCGTSATGAFFCFGGTESATCPAATADAAHTIEVSMCEACELAGNVWCIKGTGAAQIRTCVPYAKVLGLCPGGANAFTQKYCGGITDVAETVEKEALFALTCESCTTGAGGKWCIKDHESSYKNKFCETSADQSSLCLGGNRMDTCPTAALPEAQHQEDLNTCAKCTEHHTWCTKGTGNEEIRTCVRKDRATALCTADNGWTPHTTCAVPADATDDKVAKTCADCSGKWCFKEFGGGKRNIHCLPTAAAEAACLGGRVFKTCPKDTDASIDVPNCDTCVGLGRKWCIKGDGADKTRTCVEATADCSGGHTDCAIDNAEKQTTDDMFIPVVAPLSCQACVTGGGKWCIKEYGGGKKNRHCARDPDRCLDGELLAQCPDDAVASIDVRDCDTCLGLEHKWCIKGAGKDKIKTCIHKDSGVGCDGGTFAPTCGNISPETDRNTSDTIEASACQVCVNTLNAANTYKVWCIKAGKTVSGCVSTADACTGGQGHTACDLLTPADQAAKTNVLACTECMQFGHTWCKTVGGTTASETCKVAGDCRGEVITTCIAPNALSNTPTTDNGGAGGAGQAKKPDANTKDGAALTSTISWSTIILSSILVATV